MEFTRGFEHFLQPNESLARHTWIRLGGPAQYLAEPTSQEELEQLVIRCRDEEVPVRVLGSGSNIVVRDEGVPGVVIRLTAGEFCKIRVDGNKLFVGAGAKLAHVISTSVRDGLAGLEQLVGIPGSVGGALHGNSGTHGGDIGQFTRRAHVLTRSGELITREASDMHFAHHHSSLDELAILSAEFELEEEDPRQIARRMQTLWIVKRAEMPTNTHGAGYVFQNPRGGSAAELIEQSGLKAARIGGAKVSSKNANIIVIQPETTSDDVLHLIDHVRSQVADRVGVELKLAIDIW